MKTHSWVLIILAFLSIDVAGIAQDQTVKPHDQVLSKEYVSPDNRFKIRFPDVPKEFDMPLDTTGQIVSHMVMHTSTITYWLVYTDFPINFNTGDIAALPILSDLPLIWTTTPLGGLKA